MMLVVVVVNLYGGNVMCVVMSGKQRYLIEQMEQDAQNAQKTK